MLTMLKNIVLVPVIMACAAGGTIGVMKLIKKLFPGKEFPIDPITKKMREEAEKVYEEKRHE